MDETFLININCSRILFGSQETQYTMCIDTTKISIVYELVEWIRWIFSEKNCIYLTHENSVIHELEDIRVLSKLKNFEIKPCGLPCCVHKETYRVLLNNLNLFVDWNQTKVHKFFLDKLKQINRKLVQDEINPPKTPKVRHSFIENECSKNTNEIISPEKSCVDQLVLNSYSPQTKRGLKPESPPASKSLSIFSPKGKVVDNMLINFEDSSHCNNSPKVVDKDRNSCYDFNAVKNKTVTKSPTNKIKSSRNFIRPFSLGEILSNIREDSEKQKNMEDQIKKNIPSENLDGIVTSFESYEIGTKKRQRIRKRKKPKKQDVENNDLISPHSETNCYAKNLNFNMNFKPNHIRFDVEDENDLMETDSVARELEIKNVGAEQISDSSDAALMKTETTIINSESFSKELVGNEEGQNIENTEKIIDLDDAGYGSNYQSHNVSDSLSPDINMLQSLKEKFKNAVIVKRFY